MKIELESKEMMYLCLSKIKGLNKAKRNIGITKNLTYEFQIYIIQQIIIIFKLIFNYSSAEYVFSW